MSTSDEIQAAAAGGLPVSDEVLVEQVRAGDRTAFDELIGRYQRRACSVAYRLLGNMHDALEVCQEAFVRAYRNLATLKDQARFGSWLLRIVTNLSLNFRRDRAAYRRNVSYDDCMLDDLRVAARRFEDSAARPPDARINDVETRDVVQQAINRLPDNQRSALVLFCVEQLPQREVAGILDCSVEAVKWYVFQARRKLREQLAELL
jgi:RNA polymerase sigma-70 factor (ECF subfamily)